MSTIEKAVEKLERKQAADDRAGVENDAVEQAAEEQVSEQVLRGADILDKAAVDKSLRARQKSTVEAIVADARSDAPSAVVSAQPAGHHSTAPEARALPVALPAAF